MPHIFWELRSRNLYKSPAGGNTVERRAHDRKVVGSNLAGEYSSELNCKKNNKGPVVYGAVYGPGT